MPVASMGEITTPGGRRAYRAVYKGVVDVNDGMKVMAMVGPGGPAYELPQLYVYDEDASMTAEVREAYGKMKDVAKIIAVVVRSVQLKVQVRFLLRVLNAEGTLFETEEDALKWFDSL